MGTIAVFNTPYEVPNFLGFAISFCKGKTYKPVKKNVVLNKCHSKTNRCIGIIQITKKHIIKYSCNNENMYFSLFYLIIIFLTISLIE